MGTIYIEMTHPSRIMPVHHPITLIPNRQTTLIFVRHTDNRLISIVSSRQPNLQHDEFERFDYLPRYE